VASSSGPFCPGMSSSVRVGATAFAALLESERRLLAALPPAGHAQLAAALRQLLTAAGAPCELPEPLS